MLRIAVIALITTTGHMCGAGGESTLGKRNSIRSPPMRMGLRRQLSSAIRRFQSRSDHGPHSTHRKVAALWRTSHGGGYPVVMAAGSLWLRIANRRRVLLRRRPSHTAEGYGYGAGRA